MPTINRKIILRLSRYRNTLQRFKALGFTKVFSEYLAESIGSTASQVRKDFSVFGMTGNKRGGYLINDLLDKLNVILGKITTKKVILVGAGNLGKALIKYKGFESDGIRIVACFDIDPSKWNATLTTPVLPLADMENYIRFHGIEIGIIATPDIVAQEVFTRLMESGIRGVLNFAPLQLKNESGCYVHNINLEMELENIIYFVNARPDSEQQIQNA
jgi:redox-sensing transcriptional repressor